MPKLSVRPNVAAISFAIIILFTGSVFAQPDKVARSFASIAKQVEAAVVNIDTKSRVVEPIAKGTPEPGDSKDILEFFQRQTPQRPVAGVGSGFIVDKSGYIVTNRHVVANSARITVRIDSGEEFTASVVGTDLETDLAVLKINAGRDLPFLKFGSSDNAEVGDWVIAVGSPFGLAKTVTAGIISQKKRETPYASAFQKFIQTDAAINPGNSGGPLVNLDGEVIGINSQIATSSGEFSGIAFALPSDEALVVYEQIKANGRVKRGYLGAYLDTVKAEYAKIYGLADLRGAIVVDIRDKQSAAAVAGLQTGDVVVELNGKRIDSANDLISRIASTQPDQSVEIVYMREIGNTMTRRVATLKLGERPSNDRADADPSERRPLPLNGPLPAKPFGLTLVEYTPEMAKTFPYGTAKGLIVRDIDLTSFVADVRNSLGSPAFVRGELIQKINRTAVTDLKSFSDIVSKLKIGDAVVINTLFYNPQLDTPQLKIIQFTVK